MKKIKKYFKDLARNQSDNLSKAAYGIFRLQEIFTRIRNANYPEVKSCIYAMWHGHQCCVHGIKPEDRGNTYVLVSRSFDGNIVSKIVENWGFKTIRGSSNKVVQTENGVKVKSKNAVGASKEIVSVLKEGASCAMMVDGPKGPAYVVKNGAIKLAKLAGVPIVPVVWYSPSPTLLKMRSWDDFRFPFGYTRIVNLYGEPIYVNPENSDEDDEKIRLQLQQTLAELEKAAPAAYKEAYK